MLLSLHSLVRAARLMRVFTQLTITRIIVRVTHRQLNRLSHQTLEPPFMNPEQDWMKTGRCAQRRRRVARSKVRHFAVPRFAPSGVWNDAESLLVSSVGFRSTKADVHIFVHLFVCLQFAVCSLLSETCLSLFVCLIYFFHHWQARQTKQARVDT